MNTQADHLKHLAPALVQRLQEGLKQFVQNWTDRLMADTMQQIAPDHALRFPSLVEITHLDMNERWKRGQGLKLEHYLETYPELGSPSTVPLLLIKAEYDIRQSHGDVVDVGEYAQRFSSQFERFYKAVLNDKEGTKTAKEAVPFSPVAAALLGAQPVSPPAKSRPATVSQPVMLPAPAPTPVYVQVQTQVPTPTKSRKWPWVVLLLLAAVGGGLYSQGAFEDPTKFIELVQTKLGIKKIKDDTNKDPDNPNTSTFVQGQFQPNELVESIQVKLELGAGNSTDEAIFLDLGLGFPLWLVPGNSIPATVPFGAVPQVADATNQLEAGKKSTFTFRTSGAPGRDVLNTTPQLLKGLKVGDIRRIGFASLAEKDWELSGFELLVNSKPLHAANNLKLRPKQLQQEAQAKLGGLSQGAAPASQELSNLKELVASGLATDAEKQQLADLEKQPATASSGNDQLNRLQRQLRGQSPWFEQEITLGNATAVTSNLKRSWNMFDLFTNTAHAQLSLPKITVNIPRSVRVSIVTDPSHDRSETKNYVYFQAGARKYLIGGPDFPLTSANGPQTFELDLLAGPLTSTDLRDWGVGVLSPPLVQGKGPDRWHPRRIQVDVDGQLAYDSELQEADRHTLAAIRLVPPTQLDNDGQVVVNPTNNRELYYWATGQTSGYDPKTGTIEPISVPFITEPGITITTIEPVVPPLNPDIGNIIPMDIDPANPLNPLQPVNPIDPTKPYDPCLPGELPVYPIDPIPILPPDMPVPVPQPPYPNPYPVIPQPPVIIIVGPSPQPIPAPPIYIPYPVPVPGPTPFPPGPNPPVPPAPPIPIPPPPTPPIIPIGKPIQIDAVEFSQLSRSGNTSTITVTWKITGDESTLSFYEVTLLGLEDDLSSVGLTPRAGQLTFALGTTPKGVFSVTKTVPDSFLLAWKFVLPRVEAKPLDPAVNSNSKLGPARSTTRFQPNFVNIPFRNAAQIQGPTVALSTASRLTTHTAFDLFLPENNALTLPLDSQKPSVTLSMRADDIVSATTPTHVKLLVGFAGGQAPDNTVDYQVTAFATEIPNTVGGVGTVIAIPQFTVKNQFANANGFFKLNGSEMKIHEVSAKLPASLVARMKNSTQRWSIELTLTTKNFTGDSARPVTIFNTTLTNE